ncbi:MAG: hypothetical protein ACQEVA_01520 [Myxococcota bacterium]
MPVDSTEYTFQGRWLFLAALSLMLMTSSCDCDDKIRKMISDPGERGESPTKQIDTGNLGEPGPAEQEPNDFAEQATLLELGGDLRPVVGEIRNETDRDWFALTSRNDEEWQVEVTVTPRSDRLDPVIRVAVDGAEDAALTYDVAGPGEPEVIPILAVTPEPTRIYIRGNEGSKGEYELTFKKRLSGGAIEAEPNDEVGAAELFKAPGEIQGFHDRPNDRDVYYVPRKNLTGDVFDFEVSSTGYPQDIAIYSERELESPLVRMQVPPEETARIPNLKLPEGALGIWIVSSAGESYSRERSYRLRLLPHSPEAVELEAEPNDTDETAQKIALGDELAGYLHTAEDVDRLRIYVDGVPREGDSDADAGDEPAQKPDAGEEKEKLDGTKDAGGDKAEDTGDAPEKPVDPLAELPEKEQPEHLVRVDLTPEKDTLRLALAHYVDDGDDGEPVLLEAREAGEPVVLCNVRQDAGYVDVAVRPVSSEETTITAGFDYSLRSSDVSRQEGLEIEPNDTRQEADRLTPERARTGFLTTEQDVDVYAFGVQKPAPQGKKADADAGDAGEETSNAAETVMRRVELRLEGNALNLSFDILDDEGGVVAEVNRAGVGGDEEIALDLPPGLYYVRVDSERGFNCEPYRLSVSVDETSGASEQP